LTHQAQKGIPKAEKKAEKERTPSKRGGTSKPKNTTRGTAAKLAKAAGVSRPPYAIAVDCPPILLEEQGKLPWCRVTFLTEGFLEDSKMWDGIVLEAAKKFAEDLDKQIPALNKQKDEIDKKLDNARNAMSRFDVFKGKRNDGALQCPKCAICDGVDSIVGPTGRRNESGKEVYSCRCGYSFVEP
jgi:hypothetical protein